MPAGRFYEFGEFRLDPTERLLFRTNKHVPLSPKAVDILVLLVERRGHMVDKDTLLKEIWPDTFVEEGSLTQNISVLRKILTEGRDGKELIETIPKRGYRFIAEVKEVPLDVTPRASPEESLTAPAAHVRPWRRRLLWAAPLAVALLGAAGYFTWDHLSQRSRLASRRVMLAVLPVQNMTGDSSREYVSDGLTDELIAQVGGLDPQDLGVIARTSSMAYKKTDKTVNQIGRELGVDYVLETSLRGTPEQVRFTAQLIRARDQTHLWSREFDRSARDLVALEDDVSRSIAGEIQLHLSPAAAGRMARQHAVKPESYQDYLQGRFYLSQASKQAVEKGLEYFEKAIEADPANARAYAGKADSYNTQIFLGYSWRNGIILDAKEAAQKAVALEDSLADGHTSLGFVDFMWTWEWPQAESEFRRAIELDQNYLQAHLWYAEYLAAMGRAPQADQEIQFARKLDPLSPIVGTDAGWVHFFARNYDTTVRDCHAVLERDPNFFMAHGVLALGLEGQGMYDKAILEFQKTIELSGNIGAMADLGHAYAVTGRREAARQVLLRLDDLAKQGIFIDQSYYAVIFVGMGEKGKALEALEHGRDQKSGGMVWVRFDPRYDPIRSDPRFQEILRNQGTPLH